MNNNNSKSVKVAITTLTGYNNYGNKLQNYALTKYLESLNYSIKTIDIEITDLPNPKGKFKRKIQILINPIKVIKYIKNKIYIYFKKNDVKSNTRIKNFKIWSKKNLEEFNRQVSVDNLNCLNTEFDFFITGSDQVWNPAFINYKAIPKYFLTFVKKEKSISYAASFGVSKLEDNYKELYKNWLQNFNYISVREDDGRMIVKDLLGIDVPVLADPTLLLTKEQWLNISTKHVSRPDKYVLTYFLGKQKRSLQKHIEIFAENNNCTLINLNSLKDKERYVIDPSEFLDYFNNSEMIFTDSFHGSVFSILFEKPFVVFSRGNMNSRIDTLLRKFKLEDRHWNYVENHDNYFDIDYSQVESILKDERDKSFDFFKEALGIKESK